MEHETSVTPSQLTEYAAHLYDLEDIGANIASGTFKTEGMVIVPCSMKTVAGVCHGYSDNLLLRAADVTLKERRKLVVIAGERRSARSTCATCWPCAKRAPWSCLPC